MIKARRRFEQKTDVLLRYEGVLTVASVGFPLWSDGFPLLSDDFASTLCGEDASRSLERRTSFVLCPGSERQWILAETEYKRGTFVFYLAKHTFQTGSDKTHLATLSSRDPFSRVDYVQCIAVGRSHKSQLPSQGDVFRGARGHEGMFTLDTRFSADHRLLR